MTSCLTRHKDKDVLISPFGWVIRGVASSRKLRQTISRILIKVPILTDDELFGSWINLLGGVSTKQQACLPHPTVSKDVMAPGELEKGGTGRSASTGRSL